MLRSGALPPPVKRFPPPPATAPLSIPSSSAAWPSPRLRAESDAILARARELQARSKSAETLRSYRTSWAQWCGFCARMGYHPLAGDAQAVGFFLAHLSRSKSLTTVRTRLAAIAAAHRLVGIDLDLRSSPIATLLMGFKRERGTKPLKQATPLLLEVLPRFLKAYAGETAAERRDKAVLLLGFASALRRSELVVLDLVDVEFDPQGVLLTIARSKTDPEGKGDLVAVHRGVNRDLCPVTALEEWLLSRGQERGPLFTRLRKGGRPSSERLKPQAVALIIKRAALAVGLEARTFSSHSLRAGLATSAALAGADLKDIMAQTRHRSHDVAMRYIRRAEVWKGQCHQAPLRRR
jgi:integrase